MELYATFFSTVYVEASQRVDANLVMAEHLSFTAIGYFLTTLTFLSVTTGISSLTNITLGGLFSLGGPGSDWDGTATLKAAEMALMHVNNDPDVLPGYFLNIDTKNSKVRIEAQFVLTFMRKQKTGCIFLQM